MAQAAHTGDLADADNTFMLVGVSILSPEILSYTAGPTGCSAARWEAMRDIIEGPPEPGAGPTPLWKRLAWFAGLAITGALSCAAIAYALSLLLR